MGIVLVPNQMHLGPFALSLIVIRVEDFNEMFVCKDCSNSEGKMALENQSGGILLWLLLFPALSWAVTSSRARVPVGAEPQEGFCLDGLFDFQGER